MVRRLGCVYYLTVNVVANSYLSSGVVVVINLLNSLVYKLMFVLRSLALIGSRLDLFVYFFLVFR